MFTNKLQIRIVSHFTDIHDIITIRYNGSVPIQWQVTSWTNADLDSYALLHHMVIISL